MSGEIMNNMENIERDREDLVYCHACGREFPSATAPPLSPCHPGRALYSRKGNLFAIPSSDLDASGN